MPKQPLDQFKPMIRALLLDKSKVSVEFTVADLELLMSILLDYAGMKEIDQNTADALVNLARFLSDVIEHRHPEVEPYLAFVFGAVVFRRADWQ